MDHNKTRLSNFEKKIEKLRSKRGYLFAGSPYFLGLFGRDSLITSWQLLNYDSSIAKNALFALAEAQGKRVQASTQEAPGKILHEYYPNDTNRVWFNKYKLPGGWLKMGRPEYLSIDSTPLFLILYSKYYEKTSDRQTLLKLWPNAKKAMNWIINYGFYNKFLRYLPKDDKLKSQSWKDGIGKLLDDAISPLAIVEVQGYTYMAIKEISRIAYMMNERKYAATLDKKANLLKKNFNQKFWMQKQKYFALAVDGNEMQMKQITSNPGQLLFTGIVNEEKAHDIVKRLFMKDMFTPYGIRTHSTKEVEFDEIAYQLGTIWPHDNWIIAEGLRQLGYNEKYDKVKSALLKAADKFDTMPEYFGVTKKNKLIPLKKMSSKPCDPQAWSLGAAINFLTTA